MFVQGGNRRDIKCRAGNRLSVNHILFVLGVVVSFAITGSAVSHKGTSLFVENGKIGAVKKAVNGIGDSTACSICKSIVFVTEMAVKGSKMNTEEIMVVVKAACIASAGKQWAQECEVLISYTEKIVEWIEKGLTPTQICQREDFCTAVEDTPDILESPVSSHAFTSSDGHKHLSDMTCFLCSRVATAIPVALLRGNQIFDTLQSKLLLACSYMPVYFKCDEAANHFDTIAEFLRSSRNPQEICVKIGVCRNDEMGHTSGGRLRQEPSPVDVATVDSNDAPCALCTQTAKVIQEIAPNGIHAVDICKVALQQVCEYYPTKVNCDKLVTLFEVLSNLLEAKTSPHDACVKLEMCARNDDEKEQTNPRREFVKATPRRSDFSTENDEFFFSRFVPVVRFSRVNLASDRLKVNGFDVGRQKGYHSVPHQSKWDVLNVYFDEFVKRLQSDRNPQEIQPLRSRNFGSGDNLSCLYCTLVARVIDVASLYGNAALDIARAILQMSCHYMPQEFQCDVLVSHFDELVKLLQSNESPEAACEKIQLCEHATKQLVAVKQSLMDLDHTRGDNDPPCEFCTDIAQVILLAKDAKQGLETAKDTLYREFADLHCKFKCDVLQSNFEVLVALLLSNTSPEDACMKIQMCSQRGANNTTHLNMPHAMDPFPKNDNTRCYFCQRVAQLIKTSSAHGIDALDVVQILRGNAWRYFPGQIKGEPLEDFSDLVSLLRGGICPRDACVQMKMCLRTNLSAMSRDQTETTEPQDSSPAFTVQ